MSYGTLYIVATPIGNLGDITLRALDTLKAVDLIAAEDTRRTIKLLNHYEIKKKMISFHEYSNEARYTEVLDMLKEGKNIAVLSDAGTPIISDPGYELVRRCQKDGIVVESLPGACAAVTAVTLCGIDCAKFVFIGFLSAKQSARKREIEKIGTMDGMPCVLYESPNRAIKTLEDISDVLGEQTLVCMCRELTKLHEEVKLAPVRELIDDLKSRQSIKGEFVLIVSENRLQEEATDEQIKSLLQECLIKKMSKKDAIAYTMTSLSVSKNRTYRLLLDDENR
ncbi:MAG: 16S rRNA (cytidine(1402)-2'-O)-methyltransferase [Christensenellaceae bacterium]